MNPYNSHEGTLVLGLYGNKEANSGSTPIYYGNGVGTYSLQGGLLTSVPDPAGGAAGTELLGVGGTGIFNQTGER